MENKENQEVQENKETQEAPYKWYILNVMAGQENKIAGEIKSMIARGALNNDVAEALVPSQQVMKIKKGKKVQEAQKMFPGYIFINANVDSEAFNALNAIPKVLGFLGSKNKPEEVSAEKMKDILSSAKEEEASNASAVFEVGETLNVTDGPFESFSGAVEEFDAEKKKVKISISIFGRATSVELELNQVEKA